MGERFAAAVCDLDLEHRAIARIEVAGGEVRSDPYAARVTDHIRFVGQHVALPVCRPEVGR